MWHPDMRCSWYTGPSNQLRAGEIEEDRAPFLEHECGLFGSQIPVWFRDCIVGFPPARGVQPGLDRTELLTAVDRKRDLMTCEKENDPVP